MAGVDDQEGWLPKFEMLGEGKLGSSGISLWMVGPGLALMGGRVSVGGGSN